MFELQHLAGHRAFDAVDAGDAVTKGNHAPDFSDVHLHCMTADLVANDLGDFFRSDIHINPDSVENSSSAAFSQLRAESLSRTFASWVATLPS